jgi:hypothetical protein
MRALLSFFTAFPGRDVALETVARKAYLLPLVGLFTGAPGAALILLGYAMPSGVAATLALGAVLLAAGLHHTDGVLDVGDALMVRGEPERRRAVLKDTRVGVGGIGALFLVYAPTLSALVLRSLRPCSQRITQSGRRVTGLARAAAVSPACGRVRPARRPVGAVDRDGGAPGGAADLRRDRRRRGGSHGGGGEDRAAGGAFGKVSGPGTNRGQKLTN